MVIGIRCFRFPYYFHAYDSSLNIMNDKYIVCHLIVRFSNQFTLGKSKGIRNKNGLKVETVLMRS